ncbi:MAG TPA: hypothetical protein VIF62_03260 [Labilithrix sp.]|jgi:hypothetical protein
MLSFPDMQQGERLVTFGGLVAFVVAACSSSSQAAPIIGGHDACATDDDCVIAQYASGCGDCPDAYSKQHVGSERCLFTPGAQPPSGCGVCDPMAAGDACSQVPRVACVAGRCETAQCTADQVYFGGGFGTHCVSRCRTHDDCALADDLRSSCCLVCPVAAPKSAIGVVDACLVADGAPIPPDCRPSMCSGVGCGPRVCPTQRAVCMQDGTCSTAPPGACPPNTTDANGRCVAP